MLLITSDGKLLPPYVEDPESWNRPNMLLLIVTAVIGFIFAHRQGFRWLMLPALPLVTYFGSYLSHLWWASRNVAAGLTEWLANADPHTLYGTHMNWATVHTLVFVLMMLFGYYSRAKCQIPGVSLNRP